MSMIDKLWQFSEIEFKIINEKNAKIQNNQKKIFKIEISIHKNLNEQLIISKLMFDNRRILDDIEMTIIKNEKTIMNWKR